MQLVACMELINMRPSCMNVTLHVETSRLSYIPLTLSTCTLGFPGIRHPDTFNLCGEDTSNYNCNPMPLSDTIVMRKRRGAIESVYRY